MLVGSKRKKLKQRIDGARMDRVDALVRHRNGQKEMVRVQYRYEQSELSKWVITAGSRISLLGKQENSFGFQQQFTGTTLERIPYRSTISGFSLFRMKTVSSTTFSLE
jgi:hypothetical protein